MERLQAHMKTCVTPPPDNPPLALDPLLLSSTAVPVPQPKTIVVASFAQDLLILSSGHRPGNNVPWPAMALSTEEAVPYPSTVSIAGMSSATGSTLTNLEVFIPTIPSPSAPATRRPSTSPLTDPEASIPLMPVTNCKEKQPGKSAKAKGKWPAPPNGKVEDMVVVGGHTGQGSKHCK